MSRLLFNSSVDTSTSEVVNQQMRGKGLSLQLKATLLAIAMGTFPVIGVGTSAYLVVNNLSRQEIEKSEQRLATDVQSHLNQYMWERFGDIQIMANQDIFTDPERRKKTTTQEKSQALEQFLKAYPIYDNIAVFDLNGDPIAQTTVTPLGNHQNPSYIQDALRTKEAVFSQPELSTKSGSFNVYSAAPIKDKDTGEIIATIRSSIPISKISNLIKELQPKLSKSYYLIDASGKVFFGPEGEYLSQVNAQGTETTKSEVTYQQKPIEEIFPTIKLLKVVQSTGSTLTVNSATHTKQLITYVPPNSLLGLPDLNWSVVLASDASVLFATQQQQRLVLLIGTGLTVVIVAVLSAYLVNLVIRPILAAAQAVEKIGQGKLDTRIPVKGKDELATLGNNINLMADQLQNLLQNLQQNTLQLKQQNDVLSNLSRNQAVIQGNAKVAAQIFTEAIAQTLNLEKVSIWLYNSDRTHLICQDQYDLSLQQHSKGAQFQVDESLEYFQKLKTQSYLAINDVQTNGTTQPLLASDLVSSDTQLLVSVPIQMAARTVGLIRCDHVKTSRFWQADEQTFVASIANLVSIVLESEFLQQEVSHLLDVVSDVEEGNLTTQAQVSDRITGLVADTFNQFIERLADVLNQVLTNTRQVSVGANQQTGLAQMVAMNAELQAQAVGQVLELTEQVENAAQSSATRAKASNKSLQTVSTTLIQGQEAIAALTQGIAELQEGSARIMQRVKTLGEFVGLADQFVQSQNQIAFTTQTLSLNASLVAARASQQRDPKQFAAAAREFDSIADQVSKLAQQTSEDLISLEQQSAQIYSVVSAVDGDVQSLGELVRQFTTGVEQSNQVFHHIQKITGEAMQAGEAVNRFSETILDASGNTANVMRGIAGLANKTAEMTQIAREKSEQMDLLSAQLLQTVQFFQLPTAMEDAKEVPAVSASDSEALLPTADCTAIEEISLMVAAQEVSANPVFPT